VAAKRASEVDVAGGDYAVKTAYQAGKQASLDEVLNWVEYALRTDTNED